jgi:hypothetical protein
VKDGGMKVINPLGISAGVSTSIKNIKWENRKVDAKSVDLPQEVFKMSV